MVRDPFWQPGDPGEADTPTGGSLAAAHHHPPVASELERAAELPADAPVLTVAELAAQAPGWPAETLLAWKRHEAAHAARPEVIALLDRELAARISGAGASRTPPA